MSRRAEQIVEHVRMRIAQQICGDLAEDGVLKVLRLGNRWDLAFHQSLKRDAKGEVVEFDIDPRLIEQFGAEASEAHPQRRWTRATVRPGRGARRAALCAHDHRAAVPDAAGAVACRDRARRGDQVARNDLVTPIAAGHGPRGVPDVLPDRQLPDADAGLLEPAHADAGPAVHRHRHHAGPGAAAAADVARRSWTALRVRRAVGLIVSEMMIGALIGIIGRMFFLALQLMATAAAQVIGFAGMPGTPIEDNEPLPAVASLMTMSAIVLLFVTDQHWEVLRGSCGILFRVPVTEPFCDRGRAERSRPACRRCVHAGAADHQPVHDLRRSSSICCSASPTS